MSKSKSIIIDGVEYVPSSSLQKAQDLDGLEYVIIRTYSAGVFAGYLKERRKDEVDLINARRLWYWDGASSLSQLAVDGVSKPRNCKFPVEVESITLLGVIEVIPCTEKARISIKEVAIWAN